ncbi:MAG TPA: hypothetical protein VLH41_06310, partial [Thermoanaerobaculia bacterium]|nr:hypothetical protein [Thermoanaerobaculia bacterium]
VFPDPSGGEATVTIFDADGNEIGSKDFALVAEGFQQFSVSTFADAVAIGRAEVQVTRGRAAGYSVVVDNVTGDSSLFTFEEPPAGWQDVLINGVARANGKNSTFFRTDGRFYNPASEDASVTVAFHDNQNANSAPLTREFIVPAGKIVDVVDVLDSFFALPVGSAGALRFRSQAPVGILCRTSNVDPTGAKPGTYGAQQKPAQLLSFLTSADAGAVVTGIRQNASFRTNLGFAAGPDGAGYSMTLKTAAGSVVATAAGSLGPFGWTQPGVQALFPGVTIPEDATLQVKVTSGSVDVFDSSIDNASGDSVVTPIMPLPVSLPSSATIGPEGGSIRSSDGILTLKVPAGALATPTPISIEITTNDAPGAVGPGYEVSPGGLAFAQPALLRLHYGTGGLDVGGIDNASLSVLTDAGWGGLIGGRVDTASRSLLIHLWNTSPSAEAASERTVLAGSFSRFGTVAAFEVRSQDPLLPFDKGARQPWLPTDGGTLLSVFFRLPASSELEEGPIVRLSKVRQISVTWSRPRRGKLSKNSGVTVGYEAPHSIPRNYVVDTLSVRLLDTESREVYLTKYDMNIIRRYWKLLVSFSMEFKCGSGSNDFSLSYARVAAHDFVMDDDLFLNSPDAQPKPAKIGETLVGGCHECTIVTQGAVGDLVFTSITGRFRPIGSNYFFIDGAMALENGFPSLTTRCPNTPFPGTYDTPYDSAPIGLFPPRPPAGFWELSNGPLDSGDQTDDGITTLSAIWTSIVP